MSFVCPACGTSNPGPAYEVPDHEYGLSQRGNYRLCNDCGTLSQDPMPNMDELASFYPDAYHSFHNRNLIVRAKHALRLKRLRSMISSNGDGHTVTGAILDYGCGDGSFLVEAAKSLTDRQFFGYEIGGELERKEFVDGRVVIIRGAPEALFDVLPECQLITLNHVIEHLPSPLETMTQLASHLTPGGRIEGQTPAADSLERTVFGQRWSGFHSPRHTVIFSRSGLKKLLERAGLNDAEVTGGFNPAGIAVSVAALTQKPDAPGRIHRSGLKWLFCLGVATSVYPIDLLSGKPGIINFSGRR